MAKSRTTYICRNCGAESAKWIGRCPSCNEWNTYTEEIVSKSTNSLVHNSSKLERLDEIEDSSAIRTKTGISELDRVLGGGLVLGSLVLVGGEPGIGKSTLMLQVALQHFGKVLYVSGEESSQQIKLRANRLAKSNTECYIFNDVNLESITSQIKEIKPSIVIIDSIQTIFSNNSDSAPGTITQIRDSSVALLRIAKEYSIPVFIIGHITKDGSIAGPKVLEHIVDVVLQFEGDHLHNYRLLRVLKNRFGASFELAVFEMYENGLREIINPSELFLPHGQEKYSGISVAATIDGAKAYLIEIQALASSAVYGTPQRTTTGYDYKRLNMILAVLEKRAGFKLAQKDVFLNIAGGLRISDPGTDLSVAAAILSSASDLAINPKTCFAAELGLSGEIRPVGKIQQRINEAEKIGFEEIVISQHHQGIDFNRKIKITMAARIDSIPKLIF